MGKRNINVGGQAVIEGVMMRCDDNIATAIRKKGRIIVNKEKYISLSKRHKLLGWPFFRGVVALFEMMYLGTKSLLFSANQAVEEEEEKLGFSHIFITMVIAVAFSIGLFVLFPYFLTYLVGLKEQSQPVIFNLIDGVFKLIILLAYIYLIGLMKDMKRVFEYHGAEHKAVHIYENRKRLVPKNADGYSTAHPRCGTSFLIIVILTGVFVFSFIPYLVKLIMPGFFSFNPVLRYLMLFFSRLLFLPVIAGISYEILKLNSRHSGNRLIRLMTLPGIWVQKLTTREPDPDQLKVAFASLKAVVPKKQKSRRSKRKAKKGKT